MRRPGKNRLTRRAKQEHKGIIGNFGYSKIPRDAAPEVSLRPGQHCTPASIPVNEPRTVAGRAFPRAVPRRGL